MKPTAPTWAARELLAVWGLKKQFYTPFPTPFLTIVGRKGTCYNNFVYDYPYRTTINEFTCVDVFW